MHDQDFASMDEEDADGGPGQRPTAGFAVRKAMSEWMESEHMLDEAEAYTEAAGQDAWEVAAEGVDEESVLGPGSRKPSLIVSRKPSIASRKPSTERPVPTEPVDADAGA